MKKFKWVEQYRFPGDTVAYPTKRLMAREIKEGDAPDVMTYRYERVARGPLTLQRKRWGEMSWWAYFWYRWYGYTDAQMIEDKFKSHVISVLSPL